ncbi:MAG: antitoxin MazE family protein [Lapillicoccus sp.]
MTVNQRVAEHRRRMRARGYRPIQIWVPDVRSARFAAEAHRQSSLLAAADRAGDDLDFVEAISIGLDERD